MDWITEKFSLYDFFNLIFSGLMFLIGLHFLGFSPISYITTEVGLPDSEALLLLIVLLICYIIGFIFQGIGSFVGRRLLPVQEKYTKTILVQENEIINNKVKLEIYQNKARELFFRKRVKIDGDAFTQDHCDYFFAYCSYTAQLSGRCHKVEKMRALKGLSMQWAVCFGVLSVVGILQPVILESIGLSSCQASGSVWVIVTSLLLSVISYGRMKENLKFWIRMVLAMYEVLDDQERFGSGSRSGEEVSGISQQADSH